MSLNELIKLLELCIAAKEQAKNCHDEMSGEIIVVAGENIVDLMKVARKWIK